MDDESRVIGAFYLLNQLSYELVAPAKNEICGTVSVCNPLGKANQRSDTITRCFRWILTRKVFRWMQVVNAQTGTLFRTDKVITQFVLLMTHPEGRPLLALSIHSLSPVESGILSAIAYSQVVESNYQLLENLS